MLGFFFGVFFAANSPDSINLQIHKSELKSWTGHVWGRNTAKRTKSDHFHFQYIRLKGATKIHASACKFHIGGSCLQNHKCTEVSKHTALLLEKWIKITNHLTLNGKWPWGRNTAYNSPIIHDKLLTFLNPTQKPRKCLCILNKPSWCLDLHLHPELLILLSDILHLYYHFSPLTKHHHHHHHHITLRANISTESPAQHLRHLSKLNEDWYTPLNILNKNLISVFITII